jgi:Gpi18-like mannosyltransferase
MIYNGDVLSYVAWGASMVKYGLRGFYDRSFVPLAPANYPPLANLFFYSSQLISDRLAANSHLPNLFATFYKMPGLIADMVAAYVIYIVSQVKKGSKWPYLAALIFLFNPALFLNSVFWGQTESLAVVFCLLSILFFFKPPATLGFVFFAIALLVKQSIAFMTPVFLILALKKTSNKTKIIGTVLFLAIFICIFPLFTGHFSVVYPFDFYLKTFGGQVHQHQVTVNAYNFWYIFKLNLISDAQKILFVSYHSLSQIITGLLVLPVIVVLLRKPSLGRTLYATALIALIVFLFLTRMHERYLYPALVFLIPLLRDPKRFAAYLVLSAAHFLNLYFIWFGTANLRISDLVLGQILSVISVWSFLYLYFDYFSAGAKIEKISDGSSAISTSSPSG